MADDVHEPMSGARVGRYELRKKLAAGGMAEIYLARVTGVGGFSKDVVLKRILPQLAESEQFFRMFLDEARIAATLAHPNVVQIYDAGETDGQYYIAMEYLDGADLATIRRHLSERDQRVALDHLIYITGGVCAGLHYAHEKADSRGEPLGIVHRDVTPQNIFVTQDGGVKLVDFGIAKASNRLSRTNYGTLKGKLAYMAPEQCQGEDVDRRGDIYALGIVLYELSTGTNPHRGGAEYAMMKEIVEGTIAAPGTFVADYPPGLEAIVMKAIAKHPDARYQTAREMQMALEEYARAERLAISALTLSDYMKPVIAAIRDEQESRSQRFADEIDAYEEYLANKAPEKPKLRRRAAEKAAEAAAASASIDGLLEELREEGADSQSRHRESRETVPNPSARARPPLVDLPVASIGIDNVNVRTGGKTVAIVLGVVLGLGGLIGYLAMTGKLKTSEPAADAGPVEFASERIVPLRGSVSVESAPEGAAVWQYLGRAPLSLIPIDTASAQRFILESEGFESKALVVNPSDWSGSGTNKQAQADVALTALHDVARGKLVVPSWTAPEEAASSPVAEPGLFTIRSTPAAAGIWLYVGKTPSVRLESVSTRSGVELRFEAAGYAPSFVEVTERDYTDKGLAVVKATLLR